ncbi:hypothetical protein ACFC8N_39750 [Streptomyces sp. NPDC055966]
MTAGRQVDLHACPSGLFDECVQVVEAAGQPFGAVVVTQDTQ